MSAKTSGKTTEPLGPLIIVVPGAWLTSRSIDKFLNELKKLGHDVRGWQLGSCDSERYGFDHDVGTMGKLLEIFVRQQQRDIVFVFHGYAAHPGTVAIRGWSKKTRMAKGLPGGIVKLILIGGPLPETGKSYLQSNGDIFKDRLVLDDWDGLRVRNPTRALFDDVSKDDLRQALRYCQPHFKSALAGIPKTIGHNDPEFDGCRAFIRTTKDQFYGNLKQKRALKQSECDWDEREIDTGYAPSLSQPEALAALVHDIIVPRPAEELKEVQDIEKVSTGGGDVVDNEQELKVGDKKAGEKETKQTDEGEQPCANAPLISSSDAEKRKITILVWATFGGAILAGGLAYLLAAGFLLPDNDADDV